MPEPRCTGIAPEPGGGGVPEPRKEDPLKCLGGEAESLNRRGLLAGRSWSEEGAAKLLGGLLELKPSVPGLHCSKGGRVGEREGVGEGGGEYVSSTSLNNPSKSLSSPLDSSAKQFNM